MASPVREHRSPQRYSLSADQTRRLGAFLERHGGISTVRLNRFSADFGCARKTIHQQVERLGYQVSRVSRPRSDPSPPGNGLDNCLDDPRGPPEISAAAEAGSGDGAGPKANSDPAPLDEEIAILAAEEVRLRDEHDCRERDLLQSIAELEGRIRDREARLEEDRAAVRK